ncbi:MAG TPA: nucleotidyltransferase family protein [Pyrinomonadaceae bacterium]|jgi:hypothetical protein|nr:nucleotidyltransferase family protein [Pyrinomonadaceae bacterium]
MKMSPAQAARVRELLRGELDWDELLRVSVRHGVMPLVCKHLTGAFAALVPEKALRDFRHHFEMNAARNLYQTGELCRILRLFESQGIEAIPYKGPALAVCAYGNVALRQFVDLDILVRPRDVTRASALLAADGYEPHFKLSAAEEKAFMRLSYVQLFTRDAGQRAVELHWAIAPRFFSFPLQTERLWQRAETVKLAGKEVRAPAPDDLLLLLCVHGSKDLWERLEWVCGIAELTRSGREIEWARLFEHAQELGSLRMILLGLSLAHTLLDAPLPPEVLRRIEDDKNIEPLNRLVRARLFAENHRAAGVKETAVFHLKTREHLRDRVRYCARLALTTTPVDWASVRLPRSLAFVYYVLRPFRLMKKYVLSPSRQ